MVMFFSLYIILKPNCRVQRYSLPFLSQEVWGHFVAGAAAEDVVEEEELDDEEEVDEDEMADFIVDEEEEEVDEHGEPSK